jgi:surface polysaccharide O-acyltransferase-like enzyme
MLAIIAHHYVVNSTVMSLFDPLCPTANQIFLQLWGMWGKTAINVFVLITGYFMCEKKLTAKRYCKMLFEIIFYSWVVWLVLSVFGYETLTWKGAIKRLLVYNVMTKQNGGFVPAFMWMYLLIPAMNVYLQNTTKRNLYWTLSVLLGMFSVCGTLLFTNVYHHVLWYGTLYFVGAAVGKYPLQWMEKNQVCVPLLVLAVILAWISVIAYRMVATWIGPYYFVSDSHKLLAFVVSFFAFLAFKNWRLPQSRLINAVASTTFGVLLIHAATDGMRKWLWQDFVNVPGAYSMPLLSLIGYSVIVMLGVFAVCSALDYLRIRFIERPVFRVYSALRG